MANALNQSQFAKQMGWSRSYVTQLKAAGRLVIDINGKVLVKESIARIDETADPAREDVTARHDSNKLAKKERPKSDEQVRYADARAQKEHYLALQAKADYEKSIGQLVSAEEMQAAVSDVVTIFRQSLENMPHRISAELVGKEMEFIRTTLKQESHNILQDLQREFDSRLKARASA